MSAGNHAQGVAYHAQRLNIPATIVMPSFTPLTKVEGTRQYGARVVLHGEGFEDATAHARRLEQEQGLAFVHPYDDTAIIAGQGTVGLELLEAVPGLDVLVVPIGGGGLIAGCAIAARHLRPGIEIIGVEAALYPSVYRLLRRLPPEPGGPTVAEGIAVKQPGGLTLPVIEELVAEVLLVGEDEIEAAMTRLLESEKIVAEGAGAAALAAVLAHPQRFTGRTVGVVVSGGNVDLRLLSSVILRGLVRDGRIARLRVAITDQPGLARQGRPTDRRGRRQYRRGPPRPRLLPPLGQVSRARGHPRDPRRRPPTRNRQPPHRHRLRGERAGRPRGLDGGVSKCLDHTRGE